jgi:dTDP-4-amino-4,6-dideoxygalactose transaminase
VIISATPYPKLTFLLKASSIHLKAEHLWPNSRQINFSYYFARGSHALAFSIKHAWRQMYLNKGSVWFPGYFCNEALTPLRQLGIPLFFYPIRRDLLPDWKAIKKLLNAQNQPKVFICVHFFGFQNDISTSKRFCSENNAFLIHDAAHMLTLKNCGAYSNEAAIFSPRKILNTPDGGVAVLPENINIHHLSFRRHKQDLCVLIWCIKWLLHSLFITVNVPWRRLYFKSKKKKDKSLLVGLTHPNFRYHPCSRFSLQLLSAYLNLFENVSQKRRANYCLLGNLLEKNNVFRPLFDTIPESACPYVYPLIVSKNRDKIYQWLLSQNIPAAIWPDLPPETITNPTLHQSALWLKKHILLLPVHQGLNKHHIRYVASKFNFWLKRRYF